jgi:adenosine deaminase
LTPELSYINLAIPLIDLHRHLDGSIRLQTVIDLSRQHNLPLPAWDLESLRPHVQVTDPQPGVMAFISKFHWMIQALVDYDACRRVAYENVEDAACEGLDYVELRFSPVFMSQGHDLDPAGVVEAVCDGITAGQRDFGVRANPIGILSRTYGSEAAWNELRALLTQRDRIVGLDLAGDEANFPGDLFVDHFRQASEAGWQITVHAGESAGPESIWQALRDLGAQRIGHCVAATHDPALLEYLRQQRTGVECNLTSNVQTSVVPDYPSHPVSIFLQHDLLATLNTDDPGISHIDLAYEYNIAAPAAGLTPQQIEQLQRNALEVAFLSQEEKAQLLNHSRQRSGNIAP